MAQTLIRGSSQIMTASITADRFVSSLNLASSQLADGANFLNKNGTVAMTASLNAGGFPVTNGGSPVAANDLTTKSYVDALVNGLKIHFARVVSITNVAISGLLTVDGITVADGDIILLTAQTTGTQNGFWVAHSSSWTRPAFWAAASSIPEGNYAIIDADGTSYKNTKWFITNIGTITVDTTVITFSQDLSGTIYNNGNGIALSGTTFSAKILNGLSFDGSNNIQVAVTGTGLLTSASGGVSITNATTAGQLIVGNASLNPAWVAASGDVTVSGSGAFTVNTTAGSGFLKYGAIIANETPSGAVNGTNTAFTLANSPQSSSLGLFLNGQILEPGAGNDYTISGTAITMLYAPLSGDKLRGYYTK